MMNHLIKTATSILALLIIASCGGGGGGSDSSNGGNSSGSSSSGGSITLPEDTAIPLEYAGNSDQAVITNRNAAVFLYNLLGDPGVTAIANQENSSQMADPGFGNTSHSIQKLITRNISSKNVNSDNATQPETFSDTRRQITEAYTDRESCDKGYVDYAGNINQNGLGSIAITYNSCQDGDTTVSGFAIQNVSSVDRDTGLITGASIVFNRLTININGVSLVSSGSLTMKVNLIPVDYYHTKQEVIVSNLTTLNENTGNYQKTSMLTHILDYGSSSDMTPESESWSGTIYDSTHGYVELQSLSYLIYTHYSSGAKLREGNLWFLGANNTAAYAKIINLNQFEILWGTDNDLYSSYIYMDQLYRPIVDDIADSDGDGMHNSWEVFYGLDPNNPNDADTNTDGDQKTNLMEYFTGSNPIEPTDDVPPSSGGLMLDGGTATIFPAGETVSLNFRLDAITSHDDKVIFNLFLPPSFDFHHDYCRRYGYMVQCQLNSGDVKTNPFGSSWTALTLELVLPDEIGDYPIYAVFWNISPDESRADHHFYTFPVTVDPAFVSLEVNLGSSVEQAVLDNNYRYIISITNTGTLPSDDIRVRLTYSSDAEQVNGANSSCSGDTCMIDFEFPSIPALSTETQYIEVVVPVSTGPVTLDSSITVTNDSAETNFTYANTALTLEAVMPVVDLKLHSYRYKEHVSLSTDNGEWLAEIFTAPRIDDPQGDYTSYFSIGFVLPPGLSIISRDIGHIDNPEPPYTAVFLTSAHEDRWLQSASFELTASTQGVYDFTATISSSAIDPDLSNNTVHFSAFVGESLDQIQSDIDAALDGATITIPDGYFFGDLSYQSKNIYLISENGPDQTFISPVEDGIQPGAEGTISGFTFTYGGDSIHLNNSNVNIQGNVFTDLNHSSNWWYEYSGGVDQPEYVRAINVLGVSQPVIDGNIFHRNDCFGFSTISISVDNTPAIVRNNLFADNQCNGISISSFQTVGPITIINNTFVNNKTALNVPENARVVGGYIGNNIIAENKIGIRAHTDCGANCNNFQSNLFFNNETDFADTQDQININGNISADPLFVDPDNSDYRLSIGSPAIDAGDATYAPEDDLLGNPRPVDGNGNGSAEPDIGAFEYQ